MFESVPKYFDREGNGLELLEWARLGADEEYRIVKQEHVGKYWVSTVWVGLNMSMWKSNPIKIFETMIFCDDEKDSIKGYQDRYSTEAEAREGHEIAVRMAKLEMSRGV